MPKPTTPPDLASRERSYIANNFGLMVPRDGNHGALASAAASWDDAQARSLRAASGRLTKVEDAPA